MQVLRVATCQFPVCGDPQNNGRHVRDFMRQAARNGADVVHFSQTALSGYAGWDLANQEINWSLSP
jgi:predicted amidohydrolase